MSPRFTRAKALSAALVVAALAVAVPVQMKMDSVRGVLLAERRMPTQLPLSAAASAALGGFRGVAVDILWMQANAMQNNSQYYQLMTYYHLISILQPNFPSVWDFNAWNLAYNISVEWAQPEERWLWIKKGIDFGNEGLQYNPDSVELWTDIGWFYMHKVGKDDYFDRRLQEEEGIEANLRAAQYFKKALELSNARGETNINTLRLYSQALFRHGEVLTSRGDMPGAMEYYNLSEKVTREALEDFPSDAALATMLGRIQSTKAALIGGRRRGLPPYFETWERRVYFMGVVGRLVTGMAAAVLTVVTASAAMAQDAVGYGR